MMTVETLPSAPSALTFPHKWAIVQRVGGRQGGAEGDRDTCTII